MKNNILVKKYLYRNCGWQVGMARSRCGNYIFANYLPAGNMQVMTGCLQLVASSQMMVT